MKTVAAILFISVALIFLPNLIESRRVIPGPMPPQQQPVINGNPRRPLPPNPVPLRARYVRGGGGDVQKPTTPDGLAATKAAIKAPVDLGTAYVLNLKDLTYYTKEQVQGAIAQMTHTGGYKRK